MELLYTLVRVLYVMIAIGLVIFVHELGHFLAARWAGVLVERFSIGFGPVILAFKRGDTEYAISAIPLGGYVKMLGQTDTPEVEELNDDERSYQTKTVFQRMVIISAGVVMNVLFGFFVYALAFHFGTVYQKPTIGSTLPGYPAWQAGLRGGDTVETINNTRAIDYKIVSSEVLLTNPNTGRIDLQVDRDGEKLHFNFSARKEKLRPIIGIFPAQGLKLLDRPKLDPYGPNTPAALAANPAFQRGDIIEAVDGTLVENSKQLNQLLFDKRREKVQITVRRAQSEEQAKITVEPNYVRTLGLQMKMGEVVAIQDGAPVLTATDPDGQPAEIRKGDVIKAVDDTEVDPMRLPDDIADKAGQKIKITLLRSDKGQVKPETVHIFVVPNNIPSWIDFPGIPASEQKYPMSVPSLGIAYDVLPGIHKILPDSPAANAQPALREGDDIITRAEFIIDTGIQKDKVAIDFKEDNWPTFFWFLQFTEVNEISFTIKRGDKTLNVKMQPELDKTWPIHHRGMRLEVDSAIRKEDTIWGAVVMGFEETRFSIMHLYLVLRGIFLGFISMQNFSGPLGIANIAYSLTQDSFSQMLLFLGMLSINLAIVNFLPIPILDGGHMVFLTYEGITRRQPSERWLLVANYCGLIFILGLMLFVIVQDIVRLSTNSF